ncbi:hypothetical protein EXIGLDRAFT_498356 [Exidia glandulosa HHB12029]|uniref:Uncharacterized protein n=1 Tax=Exidia glandulosa HHB12029 TaxID=1314781 RepID=A0A166N8A4_EXIGL|nr:hypothetical protein EXIGLDRAFT_498356 [Exidia glandulosa HHB12029]
MQYPLRLLAKWWRRLNNRLQVLAATNAGPNQTAEMYDAIIPQLDQYAREVRARKLVLAAHFDMDRL